MTKKRKAPDGPVESLSPPPLRPLELLRQRVDALGLMQEGLLATIRRQMQDENWISSLSRDAEEVARQLREIKPTTTSNAQASALMTHAANMRAEWNGIKHDERLRVAVRTAFDLTLALAQAKTDMEFARHVRKQQAAVENCLRAGKKGAAARKTKGSETATLVIAGGRPVGKRRMQQIRKEAKRK